MFEQRIPWRVLFCLASCCLALWPQGAAAQKKTPTVYPSAVLPFQERGAEVKGLGSQMTDLLFVRLVTDPELYLVEREEMAKVLEELELSQSGLVNPAQALDVGHLTGAKILITGSVLQAGGHLYVIAKIIGTETSRVLGASVKGRPDDDLDRLAGELAREVANTVKSRAADLVANPVTRADRLETLKQKLGKGPRPTVAIQVTERHVGQRTIDPAAETELALFCRELGFSVVDNAPGSRGEADVLLTGEGFSEFAARHGQLVSVRARLELKAVDRRTGRVLAVGRQTTVAVDLTEQIAGKTALQDAAAELASRILPQLAESARVKGKKAN
jgi:TolB-like protein